MKLPKEGDAKARDILSSRATVVIPEDVAVLIDKELSCEPVRTVARKALECAAFLRTAKDFVASVEHPLQQQLLVADEAQRTAFEEVSVHCEDVLFALGRSLLVLGREDVASTRNSGVDAVATVAWKLYDAVLDALSEIRLQEAALERFRAMEEIVIAVDEQVPLLSNEFARSMLALDDAVFRFKLENEAQSMTSVSKEENSEGTSNTTSQDITTTTTTSSTTKTDLSPADQRKMRNALLEEAGKQFTCLSAINKVSYRPFDPDAPFAPNLCLTRQSARAAVPSNITTDVCCTCTVVIGDYGKARQRVHCLDCDNGYNGTCGPCHRLSNAMCGGLLAAMAAEDAQQRPELKAISKMLFKVITTHVDPHALHHSSGMVDHCMAFTHNRVCQHYASLNRVMDTCFSYYPDRAVFGIIQDLKSSEDASAVGLVHLGGVYRRWRKTLPPMLASATPENEEVSEAGKPTTTSGETQKSYTDIAFERRQQQHEDSFVSEITIPLRFPEEQWRVPSKDIQDASSRYAYPVTELKTLWITFSELDVFTGNVAQVIKRYTERSGDFVVLSVADSPLWYAVEFGIVRTRRCAIGIFHLWEPRDILDAAELSKATFAVWDVYVFTRLVEFLSADASGGERRLPNRMLIVTATTDQEALCHRLWLSIADRFSTTRLHLVNVRVFSSEPSPSIGEGWFPEVHVAPARHVPADVDLDTLEPWERAFYESPAPAPIEPADEKISAVGVFTSGTSGGKPKGVTTKCRQWHLEVVGKFYGICENSMSAYAPSWATDKHIVWRSYLRGGKANFQCKSRSIFESLALARVTPSMSLVPFVSHQLPSLMESVALSELDRLGTVAKDTVLSILGASSSGSSSILEQPFIMRVTRCRAFATACFHMVEHILGGRMYIMSIGGAAVRPDVLDFLKRNTPSYVMENYGLTECGGVLRDNRPFPGSEVKLVDRPDLGYCTTDKPFPRGEFAVRNLEISDISEWICDEDTKVSIKARYLEDGYFLTGDIGLQRADGSYEVIDRASAVRKLANGKFFSPERVEQTIMDFIGVLVTSAGASQETGLTTEALLLARMVVTCYVASDDTDHSTIRALFLLREEEEDASTTEPPSSVLTRLLMIARRACALRGIPKDEVPSVCLREERGYDWSIASGCLTASRKPNRRALGVRLQLALQRAGSEPTSDESTTTTTSSVVVSNVDDVAAMVFQELLGMSAPSTTEGYLSRLPDLGCDSLALSRIPKLALGFMQRVRASLHASLASTTIRDVSQLPPLFWTTPSLMQQTPLSIAEALWDEASASITLNKTGDEGSSSSSAAQPLFTRQTSASFYPETTRRDVDDDAICMETMLSREGSTLFTPAAAAAAAAAAGDDGAAGAASQEEANNVTTATTTRATGNDENATNETPKDTKESDAAILSAADNLALRFYKMENDASTTLLRSLEEWESASTSPPQLGAGPAGILSQTATVLVTGTAGFFGSAILQGFLRSDWCTRVICIARGRGLESAETRTWNALKRFFPAEEHDTWYMHFQAKAHVVACDLEQDYFGLGPEGYAASFLQCRIDMIVHAAALIKSWSAEVGLDALRPANVDGTLRVCQLSLHGAAMREDRTAVPLVYVSTISVCKSQDVVKMDDGVSWTPLHDLGEGSQSYFDAYSATKYMAENLTREWAHRTCNALRIVRAPLLTWHTQTGAGNEDDWMCRFIDGVLSTRLAPISNIFSEGTSFTPVDKAARIVVDVVQHMLEVEGHLTAAESFGVVYPHDVREEEGTTNKINIRCVVKVLDEVTKEITNAARDALTNPQHHYDDRDGDASPSLRDHNTRVFMQRMIMGGLRWVPAYAWKSGLDSVTLSLPTRYHPLLDRGVLEIQRAAGIRPIHPVGVEHELELNIKDTDDVFHDDWVLPLKKYLRNHYFASQV